MKKILSTIGLGLCLSTLLLSCSKGDYNSGSGKTGYNPFGNGTSSSNTSSGNFTAKINGRAFSASSSTALKSVSEIFGATGPSSVESIALYPDALATGTYTISGGTLSAIYLAVGATSSVTPTSGTMVITSNDGTNVAGTFDLHASGLDITEGQFNLKMQ
jgi:hypothetical protein